MPSSFGDFMGVVRSGLQLVNELDYRLIAHLRGFCGITDLKHDNWLSLMSFIIFVVLLENKLKINWT